MICDIDGVRLIGLHRTDASGMLLRRYGPMRAGAAIVAFVDGKRRRPVAQSSDATVIYLAERRRQIEEQRTGIRQCISQ